MRTTNTYNNNLSPFTKDSATKPLDKNRSRTIQGSLSKSIIDRIIKPEQVTSNKYFQSQIRKGLSGKLNAEDQAALAEWLKLKESSPNPLSGEQPKQISQSGNVPGLLKNDFLNNQTDNGFKNTKPGGNIIPNFKEDDYENYQNGGNVVANPKVEVVKIGQKVASPGNRKPKPTVKKVTVTQNIKNPVQRYATVDPFNIFGNRNGVNPFSNLDRPITNARFSGGAVPKRTISENRLLGIF